MPQFAIYLQTGIINEVGVLARIFSCAVYVVRCLSALLILDLSRTEIKLPVHYLFCMPACNKTGKLFIWMS